MYSSLYVEDAGADVRRGRVGAVFDGDGRFATQVTLLGEGDFREDGFHVVGNRLYVVTGLRSARDAMCTLIDLDGAKLSDAELDELTQRIEAVRAKRKP